MVRSFLPNVNQAAKHQFKTHPHSQQYKHILASFKGGLQGCNYDVGNNWLVTLQFSKCNRLCRNRRCPPGVLRGEHLSSGFGCSSVRLGRPHVFPVSALVHMQGSCDELSFFWKELEPFVCVVSGMSFMDKTLSEPKIESRY